MSKYADKLIADMEQYGADLEERQIVEPTAALLLRAAEYFKGYEADLTARDAEIERLESEVDATRNLLTLHDVAVRFSGLPNAGTRYRQVRRKNEAAEAARKQKSR